MRERFNDSVHIETKALGDCHFFAFVMVVRRPR